ncbi:hypothetical protein VV01_01790 [Luteipulveratus halotolerans]|uniref:Uncharacterized protein n=2 Tax=Luteipulveratus halotolerans TaxID=1631356 RepID=A0A0L6CED0_9MICO|nr:hypothetical protein VV01_01790 [Luteipulveratus halotolerans]
MTDQAVEHARHLNDLGRPADALRVLTPALSSSAATEDALIEAARAQGALGQDHDAVQTLQRAQASHPSSVVLAVSLAERLHHMNDLGGALYHAQGALSLAPQSWVVHAVAANVMSDCGMRDESEHHARTALAMAPDESLSHHAMANALAPPTVRMYDRARLREAEHHLREALRIDPSDDVAMNNLARVQSKRGGGVRAAGTLSRATAANPMEPMFQANMDALLGMLTARAHLVLFVAFLVLRNVGIEDGRLSWPILVVLAMISLGLFAWVGVQLVREVPPAMLRPFLVGFARRQKLAAAWAGLLVVATTFFVAAACVGGDASTALIAVAGVALLAGAVLSWISFFVNRRKA